MTENEALWAERVEEFRRSGKTAPAFASGRGYTPSALKYWERKLKSRPRAPALARVVRPGAVIETSTDEAIEVLVGSARIAVRRGFDPGLVRELIAALSAPR